MPKTKIESENLTNSDDIGNILIGWLRLHVSLSVVILGLKYSVHNSIFCVVISKDFFAYGSIKYEWVLKRSTRYKYMTLTGTGTSGQCGTGDNGIGSVLAKSKISRTEVSQL